MPKVLIPVLRAAISEAERKLVRLFPVDERLVPLNDPENNTKAYLEGLKGLFEEDQFIIPSRIGNEPGKETMLYYFFRKPSIELVQQHFETMDRAFS